MYISDIDSSNNSADYTTWSLFADDVAILTTEPTLEACAAKLQPALNAVQNWT